MRKTIRKVIIVVPVLITNCQVSLKSKIGPVSAHSTMMVAAPMKVPGLPVARAAHLAKRVKADTCVEDLAGLLMASLLQQVFNLSVLVTSFYIFVSPFPPVSNRRPPLWHRPLRRSTEAHPALGRR